MVRNSNKSGPTKKLGKQAGDDEEKFGRLLERLTELCSTDMPPLGPPTLHYYMEILQLVEQIRTKQIGVSAKLFVSGKGDRQAKLSNFLGWAKANGIESPNVSATLFPPPYDFGLIATGPIEPSDLVVSIPHDVIMSTELLATDYDGVTNAFRTDPILSGMANVALAFQLLCEKQKILDGRRSRWQDYINLLPDTFGTPLFFNASETEMFGRISDGGVTLAEMVKLNRAVMRQYAYFHQLLRQKASNFAGLPVNAENFCFDGYRWAVSAVMTRMNLVPSGTAGKFTPALIPFWDLANHSTDGFSTDWANDKVECRAAHPCVPGQQIFLFYGQRPNSQFLLHNGFFYPENRHSVAFVRLGLSRTDTLMPLKLRKLADLGHPVVHPHCDLQVSRSPPIFDAAGLQFVRIFLATSEADLNDLETNVGRPAVLSFLQTRLKLLTMQATRSEAEVKKILDETKSQNVRNVLSLALEWRDIIQAAQLYADAELVECQKAK